MFSINRTTWRTIAAKAIALSVFGVAVAMLSLPAQARIIKRPPPPPPPPTTPGNFHVAATADGGVTLAWNASSGATGYNIYNDTTGLQLNVGNVTSYTWTEVQPGGTYSFHIVAYSGEYGTAVSAPSPEVTVTIPGAPPLPTRVQPAAPVIMLISATSNTVTVSWSESTPADEIGGYTISVNGIGAFAVSETGTTATISGLWPSYTYAVAITAYSLDGTTGALSTTGAPANVTTTASTSTPPPNAPTTPTGLNGWGDGGGEAIVSWNPSASVNEPQADIEYDIYIDGVLDIPDTSFGQTTDVYIFPHGDAIIPAQVWVVAVDQFGNESARSNILTISGF